MVLRIVNGRGDTRIAIDPTNVEEVEEIRRKFDDLIANGYNAYEVPRKGAPGEQVDRLNPESPAEMVVLIPPMAGG